MAKEHKGLSRMIIKKRLIRALPLIIILALILIALAYYKLTIDKGIWKNNEKGRPSEYTGSVKVSADTDDAGISIDKDEIIKKALKDLGYKDEDIKKMKDEEIIEILKLSNKLGRTIKSLDDVSSAELMWCLNDLYSEKLTVDELEKLLNAEIITQYPKIKNKTDDDGNKLLDGIIEFERHDTDGNSTKLTYLKKSSFDEMVNDNNTEIVKYFTLDEDGNAIIGIVDSVTEKFSTNDSEVDISQYTTTLNDKNKNKDGGYSKKVYSVSTKTIDYKSAVSQYTMPFEYLWALLTIGKDKDFVLELADLVQDSEITIGLYDNITTTTDETVDTYKKETKKEATTYTVLVNQNGMQTGLESTGPQTTTSVSDEYYVNHTFIYDDDDFVYDLTKVNVWIIDYSQDYTFSKKEKEGEPKVNVKNINKTEFKITDETSTEPVENEDKSRSITTTKTSMRYVERKQKNTYTVEKQSYVAKSKDKPKIKVDKDDDEPNFVNILCKKKHSDAKTLLTDSSNGGTPDWIFEILRGSEKTSGLVDLTKYLFYKVSNINFGFDDDNFDFSEYETASFQNFTASYGDYVVKTNDSSSAPVVTDKKKMEEGLKKWLKNASKQKTNALSVLDTVMDCQEKYHVNAVFTFAFLRNETGIGSADTNYVNRDNNWGSWNLGHKFASPQENIITITSKMESGGIYFSKGNISVSQIGAIYCPNTSDYPTQGDGWIKNVNEYMTDLYSAMGIDASPSAGSGAVANGGKGTIGVYTSTKNIKYNLYLQGSNSPWAGENYGNSHSMAKAGCGPTAAAIIASAYDANITPSTVRKSIVSSFGLGNHSSATSIQSTLKKLIPNIKTEVAGYDEAKIKKCLEKSGQVWFVVQHCKYTSGAHCMALIDYKDPGMVYVAHGTANSRPYGWNKLSELKSYNKYSSILYVGGK